MKRKTTESARAVASQTLDAGAAAAVSSVLRTCISWRDRCGRVRSLRQGENPPIQSAIKQASHRSQAYKIERKIEKRTDQAIVKVARFDRLACKDLVSILGPVPGTDHAVVALEASVPLREAHFMIARVGPAGSAQIAEASRSRDYTGQLPDVMACDAASCRAAASAVMGAAGSDALGAILVIRKAAHYEISLTDVARVSHEGCLALEPWIGSYIDFELRRLVCLVDRAHPEL